MRLKISPSIFVVLSALCFGVILASAQTESVNKALIARFKTPDHRIQDVAFSADGKMIAAAYGFYDEGGVTIWNIASRRVIATLLQKESAIGGINNIAFSAMGSYSPQQTATETLGFGSSVSGLTRER